MSLSYYMYMYRVGFSVKEMTTVNQLNKIGDNYSYMNRQSSCLCGFISCGLTMHQPQKP